MSDIDERPFATVKALSIRKTKAVDKDGSMIEGIGVRITTKEQEFGFGLAVDDGMEFCRALLELLREIKPCECPKCRARRGELPLPANAQPAGGFH